MNYNTRAFHEALHRAYTEAVTDQRQQREQGPPTPTECKVATAIFTAGIAALNDNVAERPRYRVVPAPTGTGKSSFSFAFIKALIETDPTASVLFLVETARQADATYEQLAELIGAENVAVWTGAHDRDTPERYIIRDFGFVSEHRFSKDELESRRVVVATHAFYKGENAGKARVYAGEPRRLTFIDERPRDVNTFDIDLGDIAKARDAVSVQRGDCEAVQYLTELHDTLGRIWLSSKKSDRFGTVPAMGFDWFTTREAIGVEKSLTVGRTADGVDLIRRAFGFGRTMALGFSFSSRIRPAIDDDDVDAEPNAAGAIFVGYELKMPLVGGTILLDATASIDGTAHISTNRDEVSIEELDYRNLEIRYLKNELSPDPLDKITVTEVLRSIKTAEPYAEFIKRTIANNARPGEQVLAVVHKALIEQYDLLHDTPEVKFITWGSSIGSNLYKDCTTVFLFSAFYQPVAAFTANGLGAGGRLATRENLRPYNTSNNKRTGPLFEMKEGHYRRWVKQLAMRGAARNTKPDGSCGEMRLFIAHEKLAQFLRNMSIMFPGAKPPKLEGDQKLGGVDGLAMLLKSTSATELTTVEIMNETGVEFRKSGRRYLSHPVIIEALTKRDWVFVPGKGRGNPSRFVREEA